MFIEMPLNVVSPPINETDNTDEMSNADIISVYDKGIFVWRRNNGLRKQST